MNKLHSILLLVIAVCSLSACDRAQQAIQEGRPGDAVDIYTNQFVQSPDAINAHNLGFALYNDEQYAAAMTASAYAATNETDAIAKGDAFYNAGNAAFRSGDYMRALQFYKAALNERDDEDTRVNLEVTKRKIQELAQKSQQPKQAQQQEQQEGEKQEGEQEEQQAQAQPQDESENNEDSDKQQSGQSENETNQDEEQEGQASKPDDKQEQQGTEDQPSAMLQRRMENLKEANPMNIGGRAANNPRAW